VTPDGQVVEDVVVAVNTASVAPVVGRPPLDGAPVSVDAAGAGLVDWLVLPPGCTAARSTASRPQLPTTPSVSSTVTEEPAEAVREFTLWVQSDELAAGTRSWTKGFWSEPIWTLAPESPVATPAATTMDSAFPAWKLTDGRSPFPEAK